MPAVARDSVIVREAIRRGWLPEAEAGRWRAVLTADQVEAISGEVGARFGSRVVAAGFIDEAQLQACLDEQERCWAAGELLRLGQVMVKRGLITTPQYLDLLKPVRCASCGAETPDGAACAACGLPLLERAGVEMPRDRFGRYELVDQIGTGGMGVVFRARDTELDRVVALKVLREGANADDEDVDRFAREARMAARLRHSNIVSVHEVGVERGLPYFTMDHIEGRPLSALLTEGKTPRRRLVEMIRGAAEGASFAHANGVVHRDLKPGNIMIDGAGAALIMDFGLAKDFRRESSLNTLSGTAIGTPCYMPPEQVLGELSRIGPHSDIYSLGATLYEALTNRLPFEADSTADVFRKTLDEEPLAPRRHDPTIPVDLENVCRKAMEKEPSRRYASAAEFAAELGRWLDGEPVLARPPSLLRRVGARVRRRKAWAALAVVVAVAAVAFALRESSHRDSLRAESLAAEAGRAFESNDIERAGELSRQALEADPESPGGRFWAQRVGFAQHLKRMAMPAAFVADGSLEFEPQASAPVAVDVRFEGWERQCAEALLAMSENRPGDALPLLEAVGDRDDPLRFARARCLYMLRRFDGAADAAKPLLRTPLAREAEDLYVLARVGAGLARDLAGGDPEPDYEEALRVSGAEKRAPLEVAARVAWARFHLSRGRSAEALRLLERAPPSIQTHAALADVYLSIGMGARADEEYTKAIEFDGGPEFARAGALVDRALLRRSRGRSADADGDEAAAIALLKGMHYPDAAVMLVRLRQPVDLDAYPDTARMRLARAVQHMLRGELHGAVVECDRALELNPAFAQAHLVAALASDPSAAIERARRALEINPNHDQAHRIRGDALRTRAQQAMLAGGDPVADFEAAVAAFDAALAINGEDAASWHLRAQAHNDWGNHVKSRGGDPSSHYEAAVADFGKALDLNAEYAAARHGRAMTLGNRGDFDAALADLDAALAVNTEDATAYHLRAFVLTNRGAATLEPENYVRAIEDETRALGLNPAQVEGHRQRAIARLNLARATDGDAGEAIEDATAAIARDESDALAWSIRGQAHLVDGGAEEALHDLNRSVALNAADATTLAFRGVANLMLGRRTDALDDLERALELNPALGEGYESLLEKLRGDRDF